MVYHACKVHLFYLDILCSCNTPRFKAGCTTHKINVVAALATGMKGSPFMKYTVLETQLVESNFLTLTS